MQKKKNSASCTTPSMLTKPKSPVTKDHTQYHPSYEGCLSNRL
jgi:hypothetical protein